MTKIVIVDYKMGNLFSVKKKIEKFNANAIISSDKDELHKADKFILPGVGHFKKAMNNLKELNLIETLEEEIIQKKKPILGICLGMQLMAKFSEEGNVEGFGWFDAAIKKFEVANKIKFKIPHMGWNTINQSKKSLLMKNIPENSEFYFVHSFYMKCNNKYDVLNETSYEKTFCSAVENDNVFGVQYHPEKSHDAGIQILKNFIDL